MGVGIESGRNNTTERLHLTWCTSLRAVVTYHAAAGRRESYYCRSIRPSWNVRPLVHMHAHSAGTWQPTQAPTSRTTSMGNAAGHCALIDSTAFTCWANGGPRRCQLMRQIPCFFQLKKLGHYCRCLFTLLPRLHTFLRIFTSTSNNRLLTRDKLSKT
jgi:hypothetical protein